MSRYPWCEGCDRAVFEEDDYFGDDVILCAGCLVSNHTHRCMRCGEEFACRNVGACTAGYDVLPRIVEQGPDGPTHHCPRREPQGEESGT